MCSLRDMEVYSGGFHIPPHFFNISFFWLFLSLNPPSGFAFHVGCSWEQAMSMLWECVSVVYSVMYMCYQQTLQSLHSQRRLNNVRPLLEWKCMESVSEMAASRRSHRQRWQAFIASMTHVIASRWERDVINLINHFSYIYILDWDFTYKVYHHEILCIVAD